MEAYQEVQHEASAFDALEKDFQEVLQELVGDKSLEHFRLEYEKLHRALKKSHESEKKLIKKCRELNQEIVQNAVKVQTALKLSQEDQATIQSLKKEIERAWKLVEACRARRRHVDQPGEHGEQLGPDEERAAQAPGYAPGPGGAAHVPEPDPLRQG